MDFQTYAVRELTAVAEKLADTATKQLEATIAFPIAVRGEHLATICVDDEVRIGGDGPRLANVVHRHLILALDRLTIELKAIGELRAYAQMLLDEVEYVFNADASANLNAS